MRIKTLTTYDVYNYGASLQAYALQTYLSQQGHDVEIIRYQPEYLSRKYDYRWVNPESKMSRWAVTRFMYRIAKYFQRQTTMGRKRMFDHFNHQILRETKLEYKTFEELCKNPPEADIFICGSDQIWNVLYDAGRDPAFYLEFVPKGKKKVSYAASFSYLEIDKENHERIAKSLKKFDVVSVREYHGLEILKSMEIEGTWVLDPVFLLSADYWKIFAKQGKLQEESTREPYLLVYDFEGNKLIKECAKKYAKEHHLKIYAITDTYPQLYADRNFRKAGPIEFVQMITGCSAFMSNSFHGTVFSILFHKPFYVFKRHRHAVNSRMVSLLTLFGLEDRMAEKVKDVFAQPIDWEMLEIILQEKKNESASFLRNAISE